MHLSKNLSVDPVDSGGDKKRSNMTSRFDKFIGSPKEFSTEHRLLNRTLLLGLVIAIISFVIYRLFAFPAELIRVSWLSVFLLLGLYYLSLIRRQYTLTIYLLTGCIGFAAIPVTWIYNQGILGIAPYLTIMYSAMVAVLLRGRGRTAVLTLFLLMLAVLAAEQPESLMLYSAQYFGMASTMLVMVVFFVLILNYYVEEKRKSSEYLNQLEQQKVEVEMARLDRLNNIGELAASIGHEVRNPLTTVRGFLQMFQRKRDCWQDDEVLSLMITELDRANAIISEFLSLAKNKRLEVAPCQLDSVISLLIPLMQADALREGKEVRLSLDCPALINADENELRQLILNLVRNGLDAMTKGGVVTIATGAADGTAMLSVLDSGCGIPPDIYDRLGTPFVTSKDNGTGLGIPVCMRIAQRHGAQLKISTSPAGTTFQVFFPLLG